MLSGAHPYPMLLSLVAEGATLSIVRTQDCRGLKVIPPNNAKSGTPFEAKATIPEGTAVIPPPDDLRARHTPAWPRPCSSRVDLPRRRTWRRL